MAFNPSAPRNAAYPNQRRVNDPILNAIFAASQKFWQARHIDTTGTSFDVADGLNEADTKAWAGGVAFDKKTYGDSRIILDSAQTRKRLNQIRNKHNTASARKEQILVLGQMIAHELGHTAGLGHTPNGLMSAYTDPKNVPYEIRQLAKHLIKAKDNPRVRQAEDF